jgi:hypothetical protein
MGALRRIQVWAYGLVGGCIASGASTVGITTGWNVAKSVGVDLPSLNLNAIKVMFLCGVLSHACVYLAKRPLPKLSNGDTERFEKKNKHVR